MGCVHISVIGGVHVFSFMGFREQTLVGVEVLIIINTHNYPCCYEKDLSPCCHNGFIDAPGICQAVGFARFYRKKTG